MSRKKSTLLILFSLLIIIALWSIFSLDSEVFYYESNASEVTILNGKTGEQKSIRNYDEIRVFLNRIKETPFQKFETKPEPTDGFLWSVTFDGDNPLFISGLKQVRFNNEYYFFDSEADYNNFIIIVKNLFQGIYD